jgi:alkylation response protein AidB-like acyl-CoA dehydrogenase
MTFLGIGEEYVALRDTVDDVLAERSTSATVHRIVDTGGGVNPDLDADFAKLGLFGVDVPEAHGGGGGTVAHLRHVFEGCGRAAASSRIVGTTACAAALLATGTARTWLPALADGELGGAVALPGVFDADEHAIVASAGTGGWRLTGQASHVLDAPGADLVVVLATDGAGVPVVGLVETNAPGVDIVRQHPVDRTRALGVVSFDGVDLPADQTLAEGDAARRCVAHVTNRVSLAIAADAVGVASRVLDLTTEYAVTRRQFGRAIGSFQAVKHQAADMLVRTELARALVDDAAAAIDDDRADAALRASMAKEYACGAAAWVAGRGVQIHGGIGYTWEHDMHIHLKRAKLDEALFGDRCWHRRRIVDLLSAGRRA